MPNGQPPIDLTSGLVPKPAQGIDLSAGMVPKQQETQAEQPLGFKQALGEEALGLVKGAAQLINPMNYGSALAFQPGAAVQTGAQIGAALGQDPTFRADPYAWALRQAPETIGQVAGAALAGKGLSTPTAARIGRWGAKLVSPAEAVVDTDEWRRINAAIGVRPKGIWIGKGAETLEDAATMPARGLQKIGLDSSALGKMNPLEQGYAVKPHLTKAGQAIDDAVTAAGAQGTTVNVEKPALDAIDSIKNPQAQGKALDSMIDLLNEKGITDPSAVTPAQARDLRSALRYGARFGPNADMSSLGQIRAGLYRSVTDSLHDAVPGLEDLDQHYSDLRAAADAIQAKSKIWAVRQPPTFWQNLPPTVKQALPWVLGAAGGTAAGSFIYKLTKLFGGD